MDPEKILEQGRQQGSQALWFAARKTGHELKGTLYFLIEQGYTKRLVQSAESRPVENGFHNYENGLDAFIEKALATKDCIGLVPLTEGMRTKLKEYGLDVFLFAEKDSFLYEIYRKKDSLEND